MIEAINSDSAPKAVGSYPHARRSGHWLILSGIGPRSAIDNSIPGNVYDSNGLLTQYDIAAQCHAVFANIKAVLRASNASMEDLIDVTVFLTDMTKDFSTYNRIWAEYFPNPETAPCRTTLGISALPTLIAIELKCIAILRS